jgi:hypothetical protein
LSKTLQDLVKDVQYKLKLTKAQVAERVGYSRVHFSTMMKNNSEEGRKKMYLEFSDILHNVRNGAQIINEPPPHEASESEKFYKETISDLRVIGLRLSNTNEETAVANRVLVENQKKLIDVLKQMHDPIAGAAKGTRDHPPLNLVIDRLAEMGVPKYWKTPAAGKSVLGKFLSGAPFLARE